ncbi:MAG: arabinose isomerase [Lachnospiraceae bacterium]|nr:arabinose isomerase [Lachnospiraceae bacterium]
MLVETKAKVGVFAIALGAYLPQFPSLVPEFNKQYEDFKATIPGSVEIIDGGVVTTKELSQAAGDKFRAADVDLVFMQLLTYATSYNMLPAVKDLDVPIVLVNVQKLKALDYDTAGTAEWLGEAYACGAVGEMVADLNRYGKRSAVITGVVEGGDPEVAKEIDEWCKAAQTRRRFRDTNIAQIGRPYPGMMDLYIDESNLYHRMHLYTKQFDWEKIWAIADDITDEAVIKAKAEDILNTFDVEGGANVEKVHEMAKYVVAFEQWVKDEDLGLVASHYDGYSKGQAGVVDSLLIPAFSMLIKQGTACAVEGDIKVAMAMSIMKTISGSGQLSEFYTIDFNDDLTLIGHSGSGDADFSTEKKPTMKIVDVFHGKTGGGYLTQFYPADGPVTYLAITQDMDGHFKFIAAEGELVPGKVLQNGDTIKRVKFSISPREFCNRWCETGPTHHFAAGLGRHIDTLKKVAKIFDVPLEVVTQ